MSAPAYSREGSGPHVLTAHTLVPGPDEYDNVVADDDGVCRRPHVAMFGVEGVGGR